MWYYGLASYSDSMYSTVWHPQQDSQRSDVVAAYTGISTHRAGSTMTTGMTITLSIKVIIITDNSCHNDHRNNCGKYANRKILITEDLDFGLVSLQ